MPKLVLLLLLALLLVASPEMSTAEPVASTAAATLGPPKVHRPNYKRYRGNSRSKKRRGLFKRWAARRKARRQQKAAPPRRGVIRVDAPDVKMPPKPQP